MNQALQQTQPTSLTIGRLPADISGKLAKLESVTGLSRRDLSLLALRHGVSHLESNGTVPVPAVECLPEK